MSEDVTSSPPGGSTAQVRVGQWRDISTLPEPGERPGRVFVLVEGCKEHSGLRWRRQEVGIAATWNDGFDPKHIAFIERLGDMDEGTGEVTHWLPIDLPNYPSKALTR